MTGLGLEFSHPVTWNRCRRLRSVSIFVLSVFYLNFSSMLSIPVVILINIKLRINVHVQRREACTQSSVLLLF